MCKIRHLLALDDLTKDECNAIITLGIRLKKERSSSTTNSPLAGKTIAMIFSKSSTRTRVSFQVGIYELGAQCLFMDRGDLQLTRGETIADTAKVLSRYVHGIIIRTHEHSNIEEFARNSSVPVINALTNRFHPCQLIADLQTIREYSGRLEGTRVAFLGDGANNMANSWINAAARTGIRLCIGAPADFHPDQSVVADIENRGCVTFTDDPVEAVKNADFIYTDVWVSMGCETEGDDRLRKLKPYQVNRELLAHANTNVKVMHCLPAHRGEEITGEVLDGDHSIVWDQAENRLHAQKAILAKLINK